MYIRVEDLILNFEVHDIYIYLYMLFMLVEDIFIFWNFNENKYFIW